MNNTLHQSDSVLREDRLKGDTGNFMRVVQIGACFVGAQKDIERSIHKKLREKGHESIVLFCYGQSGEEGIIKCENCFEMFFRRLLVKLFGNNPKYSYFQTKHIIEKIKKFQPDIVHLHVLHHSYIDYPRLLRFLSNINADTVFTMHDMWLFTGGCYHYLNESCDRFKTGCHNCPSVIGRLDNPIRKTNHFFELKKNLLSSLKNVNIVAVSEWVADEAKKSFLNEYPIHVIPNGLSASIPLPSQNDRKSQEFEIICVSAFWNESKGIDIILETARILGKRYHFSLVGGITDSVKANAPDNISFLGYVADKKKLFDLYSSSDLYLSASVEETFGMTFVEAAFMGIKSVGFASSAVKDTLDAVYGVCAEEKSAQSLADKVSELISGNYNRLTDIEHKSVLERFSSDLMCEKYIFLYEDLTGDRSK